MKKKIIKRIIIACVIIFVLMLVPYGVFNIKDGGSIEYKSVFYSVQKVHCMWSEGDEDGYLIGWRIEVFGKEIYDKTTFEAG